MSTVTASPSKPPPPSVAKAAEGRPETLQYELEKREAEAAARKADAGKADASKADAGKADAGKADAGKADAAKGDWARVTPSTPPPAPPADPDKWGTSTLIGQQAPVIPREADAARAEATGKTSATPRAPDVSETIHRGASQLADALGTGFRAASRSLAESSPGALEALLPGAPSAALVGEDPLVALSARLAAESDFWRRLALRSLSRAVIADRAGYVVATLHVIGGLGLAVVSGLGAVFSGEHAAGKSGLLLVGALAVLCGGGIAFAFTHVIRRGQRDTASAAFVRADQIELRLQRLALAIALRGSDADAFRAALGRVTESGS